MQPRGWTSYQEISKELILSLIDVTSKDISPKDEPLDDQLLVLYILIYSLHMIYVFIM